MHALPNCRLARRSLDIFGRLGICNQICQTNRSNVSVDQGVGESVAEAGTKSSQETRDFFVFSFDRYSATDAALREIAASAIRGRQGNRHAPQGGRRSLS